MIPRSREVMGGLLIAIVGLWMTHAVWQVARETGHFASAGAAGPGFAILGIALVLMPGYKSERVARGESLEGKEGWDLLTPRWKVVTLLVVVVTIAYFFLLTSGL